jgi:3-hydroxybutyryl-CoA dehydratase
MKARIGKTIAQLKVGDKAYFAKTLTESDMMLFAGITGDLNQLPINEEFAKRTVFGRRIAHGMLTAGFITTILGMKLPGFGTAIHKMNVRFTAPVFLGDTIEVCVELTEIRTEQNRVDFKATVINQRNETVLEGSGEVAPPVVIDEE